MNKRRFFINSLILTANSVLLSVIGMLLRIYQTGVVGAEGMGLLQLLLSVYFVATNVAASGLNLACTRLVSEARARNPQISVGGILRRCLGMGLLLGIAAAGLLLGFAEPVGNLWLGDGRCVPSLRILAVGLPFFAVSCCLRGYFLALHNSTVPCLGQLLEQLSGFCVLLLVLPRWAEKGLAAACCGITLSMTCGEIAGSLFISGCCLKKYRPRCRGAEEPASFRRIFGIAAPVACGYYLRSALVSVENVLIPAGLKRSGSSYHAALAGYGTVKGMVWPVLTIPSACLAALSTLLVPEVAEARAIHRDADIRGMAARVFQICLLFSSLVMGIFFWFGPELGTALYHSAEAGRLLRLLCPLVPFLYLDSIVDAMLKGMNEQVYSLKVNLSDSCLRILLLILLLPFCGINGLLIATFFSGLYNSTLSIGRLMHKSKLHFSFCRWILLPVLCVSLAAQAGEAAFRLLAPFIGAAGLAGKLLTTVLLYIPLLRLTGALRAEDLRRVRERFRPFYSEKSSDPLHKPGRAGIIKREKR